ncbi:MAG: hypothetical protein WBW84_00750 [Acidobacteriaceae bacterium]
MARVSALGAVVRIGLIAATLDISENLIFNAFRHITPGMIFRYIASGLLGMAAIRGGAAMVALGVAIHYMIALAWTAVYFMVARPWRVLVRRPVVCGLLFGALVYAVMNFVVLPLTRVPRTHAAMTMASRVSGVLALLFCIGLTVALLTAKEQGAGVGHRV